MRKVIGALLGAVGAAVLAIGVVFVVGMRAKSPQVLGAVRRMNRDVLNPRAMAKAGTAGASASLVRHTGRTSGKPYETPVGAVPTDDGFVIALPYGSQADWLKNVLASGSATVVHEGTTYAVEQPEVVPLEAVASRFGPGDRRAFRVFGVEECLQLRTVGTAA